MQNESEKFGRLEFIKRLSLAVAGAFVPNLAEANSNITDSRIYVPGVGQVKLADKLTPNGHFNWAEVTKNGSRPIPNEEITAGVFRIADCMEKVRAYFGNKPISVNSWYRDPQTNASVNGAPSSQHLLGQAVDFNVQGMKPYQVHAHLNKWLGNRGGLGRYHAFTHIDCRGKLARWNGP